MTARRRTLALAAVVAFTAGGFAIGTGDERMRAAPESRAQTLYRASLDARVRGDETAEQLLLLSAISTDPGHLAAWIGLLQWQVAPPAWLRDSLRTLIARGRASSACLRLIGRQELLPVRRDPPSPGCAMLRSYPAAGEFRSRIDSLLLLARGYRSPELYGWVLGELNAYSEGRAELPRVIAELEADELEPLRLLGIGSRVLLLHGLARHEEAMTLERGLVENASIDRPGLASTVASTLEAHTVFSSPDPAVAAHHEDAVRQAFELRRLIAEAGGTERRATAEYGHGRWLFTHGHLRAAIAAYTTVIALADSLDDRALRARSLARRGQALVKTGQTAAAERDLLAALDGPGAGDSEWALEGNHNLLHLYETQPGREPEARAAGEASIALLPVSPMRVVAHRDLALFLHRSGQRDDARRHFEAMIADIDTIGREYLWAGEYFELSGDLERASRYYRRAGEEASYDTRALAALARVAEAMDDLAAAERYARAHDAHRQRGFPEAALLLPGLLARQGRPGEAIRALEVARHAALMEQQQAVAARLSYDLAEVRLRSHDASGAAADADRAARAARAVGLRELELRAAALGEVARARTGEAAAVRAAGVLTSLAAQAQRTGWPQLRADIRLALAEALRSAGRPQRALASLARAALDVDTIASSLSSDPTRSGYRASQQRLSDLALEIVVRGRAEPWATDEFARWSNWRKARGLQNGGSSLPADPARRLLRPEPDRAVIDFALLDGIAAAMLITSDTILLVELPAPPDSLRAWSRRLGAALAPRIGRLIDRRHVRFDSAGARSLHRALLAPLEIHMAGRTHVTIIPDAELHVLPFDALLDSLGRFAVERYTIALAPSLATAGGDVAVPATVVAVAGPGNGVPVPGSADEIDSIVATFGAHRVTALAGAAATEAALRAEARGARILHLAVHARANNTDAALGRLSLVPDAADDGVLHAFEIERLQLAGSLVVLSSCETASGRLAGGEGILSLSRAFLRAGADATIATLWPVGEETAALMSVMYRRLAAGMPPARALREAKLAGLRGGSEPGAWASFILVSRSR